MVPISLKGIMLSGAPCTGVGHSNSQGTMHNSSTNDRMHWKHKKLRKDVQEIVFIHNGSALVFLAFL